MRFLIEKYTAMCRWEVRNKETVRAETQNFSNHTKRKFKHASKSARNKEMKKNLKKQKLCMSMNDMANQAVIKTAKEAIRKTTVEE